MTCDAAKKWEADEGIWVVTAHNDEKPVDGSKVSIRSRHGLDIKRFLCVLQTGEEQFTTCISTSGHEPV
jgi:hypothetical protein